MKCETKVMVNIPNWDKYQKKMTRRSRDWIAMSTEMLSDPCVRELPAEAFKCWVGLLLHAGKVGVPFKFSASSARVLFGLRHSSVRVSPEFGHSSVLSLLQNQGLISLTVYDSTRQDITRQDKTVALDAQASVPDAPKKKQKPPKEPDPNFDAFWDSYPLKVGKAAAAKEWAKKPRDSAALITDIATRVNNDRQWQPGSQFIPHARTYLSQERWNDAIQPIVNQPARIVKPTTDSDWLKLANDHGIRTKGKGYNEIWNEFLSKRGAAA